MIPRVAELEVLETTTQYQDAGRALVSARKILKEIEADKKSLTAPIKEAAKNIEARYKPLEVQIKGCATKLESLILRFDAAQRERLARETEAKAKRAEKRGETELAQDMRQAVVLAPAVVPLAAMEMVNRWRGEVSDLQAFLAHVAAGRLPQSCIEIKQGEIDRLAREYKETLETTFPGLKAICTKGLRS